MLHNLPVLAHTFAPMIDFWNERYSQIDYVYGTRPNAFFKQEIEKLPPGSILLPAEGEGRNAVFAAHLGWQVDAYDQTEVGQNKALQLAKNVGVSINYQVSAHDEVNLPKDHYDMCALIFTHTTPEGRRSLHQKVIAALKPGGAVLLEAFDKSQLGNESGGPQQLEMLFSLAELKEDFASMDIQLLEQKSITIDEGIYHRGQAEVVRLIARKK